MGLLASKAGFGFARLHETTGSEIVTFTASQSGPGTSIAAVCERGLTRRTVIDTAGIKSLVEIDILTVHAKENDVSSAVLDSSSITRGGEVWTVKRRIGPNAGLITLECEQPELKRSGTQRLRFGG